MARPSVQGLDFPAAEEHGGYVNLEVNTGNVWKSLHDLEQKFRLRYGGGIGLALDSIIGPITVPVMAGGTRCIFLLVVRVDVVEEEALCNP